MTDEEILKGFDWILLEAMSTKRVTKLKTLINKIKIPREDIVMRTALVRYARQEHVKGLIIAEVIKLRAAQLVEQGACVAGRDNQSWRRVDLLEEIARQG